MQVTIHADNAATVAKLHTSSASNRNFLALECQLDVIVAIT